ncbi:MAG: hypothetical protein Q8M76_14340, partial [Spirochaetaceae bacterium]|nr:hypothetical protein [Spirochaetaceae bacterium]
RALSTATVLAARFRRSELGSRAFAAKARGDEVQTEWDIAIGYEAGAGAERRAARGRIDLAFVEAGRGVVVDFKTDAALVPGRHESQLAAYARAASDILGLPVEAWLYYFYGGPDGRALPVDPEGRPELGIRPGQAGTESARFDPRFGPAPRNGGRREGER